MSLEVIYVTRHGFRSSWSVNHRTGEYTAALATPTGIPSDPELTSHGVDQAKQLGHHLRGVDPPIERVYSSPYYRCLQTIEPFVSLSQGSTGGAVHRTDGQGEAEGEWNFAIKAEPGVGEWYGSAHFEHPTSAAPEVLKSHFPAIDLSYQPFTCPPRTGESLAELHDRVAATMQDIIAQCDRDGVRAIVICTHAAVVIALGRVLTGKMPADVGEEDFRAFTCGLSIYQRKKVDASAVAGSGAEGKDKNNNDNTSFSSGRASGDPASAREAKKGPKGNSGPDLTNLVQTTSTPMTPQPTPASSSPLPKIRAERSLITPAWKGSGVAGGWECLANSDCSHLSAGEERGWRFSGDEAFTSSSETGVDAGMGVVVEGKKSSGAGTVSRL